MKKEPILYIIVKPIITVLFRIIFHPNIINKEYIPKKGPIVLGGNHTNYLDCLLIISSTKRKVHFLAKDSLYKGVKGVIFRCMGIIPVNRKIHDKDALEKAKESLRNNQAIGIFPEGTINRGKDLVMPFKIGCVKMAHDTNAKIIPFVIKGKYRVFGKSAAIKFLEPYTPIDNDLDKENNKLMELIKEELRREW